jgi:hypothetical protein
MNAARSWTDVSSSRHTAKSCSDCRSGLPDLDASLFWIDTTRSPSLIGSVGSSIESMKPNPPAPMAIATDIPITDTTDKPGYFMSIRKPSLMSSAEKRIVSKSSSPREARASDLWLSMWPNSMRARRPASSGRSPRRIRSSVLSSR